MTHVTEAMHQHHAELLRRVSEEVRRLDQEPAAADPGAFARLLTDDLLPHAVGEERHLYHVIDPLIKAHGSATATMSVDHEVITSYIREIEALAQDAGMADAARRPALIARLARTGLQLEAVFRLHLRKEEEVYLPLFEQHVSLEQQQQVLDGMHAVQPATTAATAVVDVRPITPPQRHPLIFQTFAALTPGSSFTLVNDHDPKPLHYQFMYEHEGEFTWEYEERGPSIWRVRIGRPAV